jgi:hypothetical protein
MSQAYVSRGELFASRIHTGVAEDQGLEAYLRPVSFPFLLVFPQLPLFRTELSCLTGNFLQCWAFYEG